MRCLHAFFANEPLVGSTEFSNVRYHARIDYPVKTINAVNANAFIRPTPGPCCSRALPVNPRILRMGPTWLSRRSTAPNGVPGAEPDPVGIGVWVYHYAGRPE